MFGLFKPSKPYEPLNSEKRGYFNNNILWLNQEFPEPPLLARKVFIPTTTDFPIKWDNSELSARKALKIIAESMEIDINEIHLEFFSHGMKEINMGSSVLFLENEEGSTQAAGLYQEKNEDGKYVISLDQDNLNRPDALVATLAHELSHVKLLGQLGLKENDEMLTDLATIFFGFGIFGANTAFHFYQGNDRWGYSKMGYLNQEEWAYGLALFAYLRNEQKPEWIKFLNVTVKKEFEKSLNYIIENKESIEEFGQNDQ